MPDDKNENISAMQMLQKDMAGEWEKAGIYSEADIDELCREFRDEIEAEYEIR
jgi:hypothetical protein